MSRQTADRYDSLTEAQRRAKDALSPRPPAPISLRWIGAVKLIRWVFPVLAIIFALSTLVWPFLNTTEVAFTLSKDEVAQGDGEVRMTNLHFVGTDTDDRRYDIWAREGGQKNPSARRITLRDITLETTVSADQPLTAEASSGLYRVEDSTLLLAGGVKIGAAEFDLTMAGVEIDLKTKIAVGEGNVQGDGTLGSLTADRMILNIEDRIGSFEGGVRMHIIPKRPAKTEE